jgi:hypothetical protein
MRADWNRSSGGARSVGSGTTGSEVTDGDAVSEGRGTGEGAVVSGDRQATAAMSAKKANRNKSPDSLGLTDLGSCLLSWLLPEVSYRVNEYCGMSGSAGCWGAPLCGEGPGREPLICDWEPVAILSEELLDEARSLYRQRFDTGRDSRG